MNDMSQTTVNLGYVPKNRGEYSSTASYYKDNIVQYNGSSYICNPPNYDPDTAPTASITGVAPYASDPAVPNTGWAVFCNDSSGVGEGVYDVSVDHTTDNQPKKYADLSAALQDVPQAKHKGGMTIRFIQSSDNKYIQYRLMADSWSTDTTQWQGVDEVPAAGSSNLVESGGTFEKVQAVEAMVAPVTITPSYSEIGYYVNNGVYIPQSAQTSEIVFVHKGTILKVTFGYGTTVRYGIYSAKPAEDDSTSVYGSYTSSPFWLEVTSDGYLAMSHVTTVPITIASYIKPIDSTPTDNSDNLVKSGGVKAAIDAVETEVENVAFSTGEKITEVGIDGKPTASNNKLVKSGGVFEEMQGIESFAVPGVMTPMATKAGYWVNNDGTYEAYSIQTTDIVRVRKGAKISVSFNGSAVTLRYGLFSSMPVVDDTASIHDTTTTSPCVITIQNDGYLALAHITSAAIEISSLGQPVDDVPTQNSDNTVKSGGVYGAIQQLSAGINTKINSTLDWKGLSISYIKDVDYSGNLFKIAKKISDDGYYIGSIRSDGTLYFNQGVAGYRSYLIPVDGVSTYKFTYGRFIVLMKDETHAVDGATVQTYTFSVSSVGAKYIAFSFNSSDYPEETYQVGVGSLQADPVFKVPYLKVGTDNLEDNAVTFDKIGFVLSNNLFNINDPDNVIGKYIKGNTLYSGDGSYNTTGYIPVEPNTTYQCSNGGDIRAGVYLARYVCQYSSDKSYISGVDLQPSQFINRFTTGANTYFIRVSAKGAYWEKYQIEVGSVATAWEAYKHVIDPQYLPKESFYHFEGSATLAQNETLTLPQSYSRKNVAFTALIDGADDANLDVLIGLGYNKFRGAWLELTPTKVIVHEYATTDSTTEYNHGLTLGSEAIVNFDAGTTDATIKVISDGNVFSQSIDRGFFFGGAGFVTNKGSNSVDARLSVMLKDVTKKVWLFGDSYLSWNDSARWPYWMLQWGFESWMSDSLPGGNSDTGYVSFGNDIKIGKPVYLLWANGMNDTADADVNTPNATWLGYVTNVVSTCEEKGITPVLATIPSVPSKLHDGKNKWIRESGYRYIDFAAAVGATSAGVWKTGMLAGDNVHPTTLGAKALASQVLIDFPEIMVE